MRLKFLIVASVPFIADNQLSPPSSSGCGNRIPQYTRERFYQVEQVLLDKGVELAKANCDGKFGTRR
jgi:hypothetical protein